MVPKSFVKPTLKQSKISFSLTPSTPKSSGATAGVSEVGKKGATRGLGRFSSNHPDLIGFKKHLMGIDGGFREDRAACAIVTDVAKLLKFVNPRELRWEGLVDATALRRFVDMLGERNVGAPGLLGKLNSIEQALRYLEILLSKNPEVQAVATSSINGVRAIMQVSMVIFVLIKCMSYEFGYCERLI